MKLDKKLAIIDFDGTLADSMWAWDGLGREVIASLDLPEYENYDKMVRELTMQQFAAVLSKMYPDLDAARPFIDRFSDVMRRYYLNDVPLKKGAVRFLETLKQREFRLCLASATDKNLILAACDHFDIVKYFDLILTADDVGCGKSEPKIYYEAMSRFGVAPSETVIFEDAYHAVLTAKKTGALVVAVEDASMSCFKDKIKQTADYYVTSLDEAI